VCNSSLGFRFRNAVVLLKLCSLLAKADALAGVTPVLDGSSYALTPLLSSPGSSSVDGGFLNASFSSLSGSLVWDSTNNSVGYVLDAGSVRRVDFANGLVSTMFQGLSNTVEMCGSSVLPQTLYITRLDGYIQSCNMSGSCTLWGGVGNTLSCVVTTDANLVYYTTADGGVRSLHFGPPSGPVVGTVAAPGSFEQPGGLALDYSGSYLYVTDMSASVVSAVSVNPPNNIVTVAGNRGIFAGIQIFNSIQCPLRASGPGIHHYAPAPGLHANFSQPMGLAWSPDRSVLYVNDQFSAGSLPIRALTFPSGPLSATVSDLGIDNQHSCSQQSTDGVGVDPATGMLYALHASMDGTSANIFVTTGAPPPPPNPPPTPPPRPSPPPAPPMPPAKAYLGGSPRFVPCWNAAQQLELAPEVVNSQNYINTTGLVGGWQFSAVRRSSGAPTTTTTSTEYIYTMSGDYLRPKPSNDYWSGSSEMIYFSNSGLLAHPPPATTVGSSAGLTISFWFMPPAFGQKRPVDLFAISKLGTSGGLNTTLLFSFYWGGWYHGWMVIASVSRCCGGLYPSSSDSSSADIASDTTLDAPFSDSTGDDYFATYGKPNNVMATFNGSGSMTALYWNGVQQKSGPQKPGAGFRALELGTLPFGPVSMVSLGFNGGKKGVEHELLAFYTPQSLGRRRLSAAPAGMEAHNFLLEEGVSGKMGELDIYNYEMSAGQVHALLIGDTSLCPPKPPSPASPPVPPSPAATIMTPPTPPARARSSQLPPPC
jgi:hypothetical protein